MLEAQRWETLQRAQAASKDLLKEEESRKVLLGEEETSSPAHQSFKDKLYG